MKCFVQWAEYVAYNGGGWSKQAKKKPERVIESAVAEVHQIGGGKKFRITGVGKKLKFNAFDLERMTWIRRDYPDVKSPSWLNDPLVCAGKAAAIQPEDNQEPVETQLL